jgi:hypothetical protein
VHYSKAAVTILQSEDPTLINRATAITAEAATANNDFARLSSGHVVRVYGHGRCPLCLRRRLPASDVHEIEAGFAWTCSACHRDVVIVTTE